MDQHYGYIDSNRAYTVLELSQIVQFSKESKTPVKVSTIKDNLRKIGCPVSYLGRTAFVSGRLLLLAIERNGLESINDDE